jgi:hypothetical protein
MVSNTVIHFACFIHQCSIMAGSQIDFFELLAFNNSYIKIGLLCKSHVTYKLNTSSYHLSANGVIKIIQSLWFGL